ncbi:MAG: MFS transporter [Pseudomonadota bacterium]
MSNAKTLPPARRIGTPTMIAYSLGAVAYGVKDAGFGTFLLLYYNQVVGLPPASVGLAILCALVLDALIDPAIGFLSDKTRSRWGRRHPWMYGSAMPIAIGWLLLWNPPAWGVPALLGWLFVTAVAVRTAVSAYEVPSVALTPELTTDYDERTRIMAYRYLFGWGGAMVVLAAAYTLLLVNPAGELDLHYRPGYVRFALVSTAAIVLAILISSLGTHHEIKRLPRSEAAGGEEAHGLRELFQTLRNPAFLTLMMAGLFLYTNQGMSFAMSTYLYSYVWLFDRTAFALLSAVLFIGALAAFVIAPWCGRRFGKPRAAALATALAAMLLTLPYALRLAGVFPQPGDAALLPLLFAIYICNTTCTVAATMLGASMMADVVEHSEVETGRRSEGVFFAGAFFVQKCTSGIGIFMTSLILQMAGLSETMRPGDVGAATVDRLTILYCGIYLCFGFIAALLYRRFPFGRDEHEARVSRLAAGD